MPTQHTPFDSSLFTQAVFKRTKPQAAPIAPQCITFAVDAPCILPTQRLLLVGGCDALGAWDISRGVVMFDAKYPLWVSDALLPTEELLCSEYKFVLVDEQSGALIAWEEGDNRSVHRDYEHADGCKITVDAPRFAVAPWRAAGVAIPLFSIRTEHSMGVGEFLDLKPMADWAAATGQCILQILPINDTTMTKTWQDSYPYNANSTFALHPQYISLLQAGRLKDEALVMEFIARGEALNALAQVDYEAVNTMKEEYLRLLYIEQGNECFATDGFATFFEENRFWLEPYALFSWLRDKYHTPDFAQWGSEACYTDELLSHYATPGAHHYTELAYHYFVQYHLHLQLLEAHDYAHSKGITFKGDIPIGISRTSVDAWVYPQLFHLNAQAGAPPDDFSVLGQNWGFPTYNWDEMARDGYAWWRSRFVKMAEYFDAYRIDHILGFFRIWEIPLDAIHGLLGYFSPAMPLTPDEMRDRFGFYFEEIYARPAINDWLLDHLFGAHAQTIAGTYLEHLEGGDYRFRQAYDSQVKLAASVADQTMRDKLMMLFNEVLFIEDPRLKGCYHPRITGYQTSRFNAMSDWDKQRYMALYNDFYYHRHTDFWYHQAMQKLPALIHATSMLTCGEDLGMIPDCVPSVMAQEQILSLEIQRMPKDPTVAFAHPADYPYLSVCTTSTHDMDPLRAWLLDDASLTTDYLAKMLNRHGETLGTDVPVEICASIIHQHLESPAMFTILPLQDWLSMDEAMRNPDPHAERINVPAVSRHYWRYRMHMTVEQLLASTAFNTRLREMIVQHGR